jgi:hypothetical protein
MLGLVSILALQAVWYQKWFVHRTLRPEEFGGHVHFSLSGSATYPIHTDVLRSKAISQVYSQNGTYLLPLAYPEGCPRHPSYAQGLDRLVSVKESLEDRGTGARNRAMIRPAAGTAAIPLCSHAEDSESVLDFMERPMRIELTPEPWQVRSNNLRRWNGGTYNKKKQLQLENDGKRHQSTAAGPAVTVTGRRSLTTPQRLQIPSSLASIEDSSNRLSLRVHKLVALPFCLTSERTSATWPRKLLS